MSSRTRYFVISWTDQQRRNRGPYPTTREYGTASTKQAAIRFAKRALPPVADYIVRTVTRTVHTGRTPPAQNVVRGDLEPAGADEMSVATRYPQLGRSPVCPCRTPATIGRSAGCRPPCAGHDTTKEAQP